VRKIVKRQSHRELYGSLRALRPHSKQFSIAHLRPGWVPG